MNRKNEQKTAPTKRSSRDEVQSFHVWALTPSYDEDPQPWKRVASFVFLRDCLDYISDLQDHGVNTVFQSPADCVPVKATDPRMVYKPDALTTSKPILQPVHCP
jgi:hypothetical protein